MEGPALVWFRLDLRLADNEALHRALAAHRAVIPVFIWAPEEEAPWSPGAASRWWLHHSLLALQAALAGRGSKLVIRRGPSEDSLRNLVSETGARAIFWNRRYEPAMIARDRHIQQRIERSGLTAQSCPGNLLFEPWTLQNSSGKPFRVFSAFWRACLAMPSPPDPKALPSTIAAPAQWPASLGISDLGLAPQHDLFRSMWQPGEAGASTQMEAFLNRPVENYSSDRNRPDAGGTSRLSPHLHFGEISARQIWHALFRSGTGERASHSREAYLRQIAWREFSCYLLFHHPHTPKESLRPEFRKFPGRVTGKWLNAWTEGATGYPFVDAGMRELRHTGWMHNRVRMVVASFLVKHLLIPWQEGAAWFWDNLVDADLANNTMGWQWTAGAGADAAPWFRIFNPALQGEKFDPEGGYVRRWVPELARLPNKWIHTPWKASRAVLADAGVELGRDYPLPVVRHEVARERALAVLTTMKTSRGS